MSANPQAFPRPIGWNGLEHHDEHAMNIQQDGMTLRDYFAAKVMQGLLSSPHLHLPVTGHAAIALDAYRLADVMLAERESKGGA